MSNNKDQTINKIDIEVNNKLEKEKLLEDLKSSN
jgi:hypothetical protein